MRGSGTCTPLPVSGSGQSNHNPPVEILGGGRFRRSWAHPHADVPAWMKPGYDKNGMAAVCVIAARVPVSFVPVFALVNSWRLLYVCELAVTDFGLVNPGQACFKVSTIVAMLHSNTVRRFLQKAAEYHAAFAK